MRTNEIQIGTVYAFHGPDGERASFDVRILSRTGRTFLGHEVFEAESVQSGQKFNVNASAIGAEAAS